MKLHGIESFTIIDAQQARSKIKDQSITIRTSSTNCSKQMQ